jgi:hypothetical protein
MAFATLGSNIYAGTAGLGVYRRPLQGCVQPPSEMVVWWPLDETSSPANDLAGVNNFGTWINNPTPVSGKVDGALQFSKGTGVNVIDHPEINFGTSDFSIDLWFRSTTTTSLMDPILSKKASNGMGPGYKFYIDQGKAGIQLSDATSGNYTSSVSVVDGNWHHIAVTVERNNSSGLRFYVDGSLVSTFDPTLHTGSLTNTAPLRIAFDRGGALDEIEFFNRALDSVDVQSIWSADSCGKCKPAITSIGEFKVISSEFKLLQCYPNPFNPSTNIEFYLPKAEFVKLSVFNALGEEVAELLNRHIQDGTHKIVFDASILPSGIYYYQLRVGEFVQTRKMILMR